MLPSLPPSSTTAAIEPQILVIVETIQLNAAGTSQFTVSAFTHIITAFQTEPKILPGPAHVHGRNLILLSPSPFHQPLCISMSPRSSLKSFPLTQLCSSTAIAHATERESRRGEAIPIVPSPIRNILG